MFLSEIPILDHCFCLLAINGRQFLEKTNVSVYPVKVKSVLCIAVAAYFICFGHSPQYDVCQESSKTRAVNTLFAKKSTIYAHTLQSSQIVKVVTLLLNATLNASVAASIAFSIRHKFEPDFPCLSHSFMFALFRCFLI